MKIIYNLMIFGGGFVSALNLSLLIDTNPAYEAAWWKVILACCIAIAGCFGKKYYDE